MHKISTVIIACNEEKRIRLVLDSVKWSDEIIVVDSGSTDSTLSICCEYPNCKVYNQPFLGYGPQKRFAVEKASNQWILSIDADEVVTEALQHEIRLKLSSSNIEEAGFHVPITLKFLGKVFSHGSEHKQPHLRLFDKSKGNFNELTLHEGVVLQGMIGKLRNEVLHLSYINTHHYFQKFNDYSTLYAVESKKRGKQISKTMAIVRIPVEFFKQYFIRLNFLNGFPGFVWAWFSTAYVFAKQVKLYESNQTLKP